MYINEKVYYNHNGSEDSTTVKINKSVENAEGRSYSVSTTKGVEWGGGVALGLQFGMPQIGLNASSKGNINYTRTKLETVTKADTKTHKLQVKSHHEETVEIPPDKKVKITMTSYRVRYKLPYTMEYKVPKTEGIPVMYDSYVSVGLIVACSKIGFLTAAQLMHTLPGYCEDDEYVHFTQEAELRWTADRMVVKKEILPL